MAMFSTTIDKISCFIKKIKIGPHEMKTSQYFSVLDTVWNILNFLIPPPPILNLFQLKLGTILILLQPPPPPPTRPLHLSGPCPNVGHFLIWKASFSYFTKSVSFSLVFQKEPIQYSHIDRKLCWKTTSQENRK